jgi:hypothetical protein
LAEEQRKEMQDRRDSYSKTMMEDAAAYKELENQKDKEEKAF